jgi:putative selenate reductase FAD-binding subunit
MINDFLWATSIEDAAELKKKNPDAEFIAGGTWINNFDNKEKPETVIGLERLGLDKIEKTECGISINSGVKIQDIADSAELPNLLKVAASNVPSRNIRNIATIGGDIGLGSTYSDLIPALVALNASVKLSDGEQVYVYDYVNSGNDDLIVSVCIPNQDGRFSALQKFTRTNNGTPVLQVAVSLEKDGSDVKNPIIAVGCLEDSVLRLEDLEEELDGKELTSKEALEEKVSKFVEGKTDWRASGEFRKYISSVIVAECLSVAFGRDK